jgi:hypothetical protein
MISDLLKAVRWKKNRLDEKLRQKDLNRKEQISIFENLNYCKQINLKQ